MKVLTDDSVGPPPKFLDDGGDIRLQRRADQESESDEAVENDNTISSEDSELNVDSEQYSYCEEEPALKWLNGCNMRNNQSFQLILLIDCRPKNYGKSFTRNSSAVVCNFVLFTLYDRW